MYSLIIPTLIQRVFRSLLLHGDCQKKYRQELAKKLYIHVFVTEFILVDPPKKGKTFKQCSLYASLFVNQSHLFVWTRYQRKKKTLPSYTCSLMHRTAKQLQSCLRGTSRRTQVFRGITQISEDISLRCTEFWRRSYQRFVDLWIYVNINPCVLICVNITTH